MFQSQTRRLPPRNIASPEMHLSLKKFQSQTRRLPPRNIRPIWPRPNRGRYRFNRRRDACLPATTKYRVRVELVRQGFNRRRDACLPATRDAMQYASNPFRVSIADATLASPQLPDDVVYTVSFLGFNRRRDACLPATTPCHRVGSGPCRFNRRRDACLPATDDPKERAMSSHRFQSQTRRLPPRNRPCRRPPGRLAGVSIADATLASPQH